TIAASSETLDLNGFTISGGNQLFHQFSTRLIHTSVAAVGTTIRNGTLAGNNVNRFNDFSNSRGSVFEDRTIWAMFGTGGQSWLGTQVIARRFHAVDSSVFIKC